MEAGKLRFTASYQEPIRGTNAYNATPVTGWKDLFPVPMNIETLKAWELVKYRSVQMDVTHRLNCRWRTEINSTGRFVYHGRVFDIYSIENVGERNVELVILANEVVKPNA
jgi:SPP1 family predicted phage head-tail adaptor